MTNASDQSANHGPNAGNTSTGDIPHAQIPTQGSTSSHSMSTPDGELKYTAIGDWITLHKIHQPVAKMFHVAYLAETTESNRPVTFVFNGGPGAASAFLHMGALGPQRVEFGPDGSIPAPPASVVENAETWLPFTDLVFIDPLGTGFSRAIEQPTEDAKAAKAKTKSPEENKDYWEIDRDVESLGEFITRFLSQHHRWTSPVFIAGESYGGFRVAKMAASLQQDHGVGLCGAMLISPAIEFEGLFGSDYNMTHWIEVFPSMVAAAHQHGLSSIDADTEIADVIAAGEAFATNELATWLASGDQLDKTIRESTADSMAKLIGLPVELILRANGRIDSSTFCRELLREKRRLLGRYDASVSTVDPYPDRDQYQGPDPTLFSIDRLFTTAANHQIRTELRVETDLDYRLLSMEVNSGWQDKKEQHVFRLAAGAMDELRYGMSLNEHMKVFVSHGYYDLITPYFASRRLADLMKLTDDQRKNLIQKNYSGGHMFYSWDQSRIAFRADTAAFYKSCLQRD